MTTILYARVSTIEQTIEHQRRHWRRGLGHRSGQASTHGSPTDRKASAYFMLRPGRGSRALVDRLGRNYDDVCATIRAFMARSVVIRTVINGMSFDGG
jgi:putative DNA-invertase from lambdoid prophage Rac